MSTKSEPGLINNWKSLVENFNNPLPLWTNQNQLIMSCIFLVNLLLNRNAWPGLTVNLSLGGKSCLYLLWVRFINSRDRLTIWEKTRKACSKGLESFYTNRSFWTLSAKSLFLFSSRRLSLQEKKIFQTKVFEIGFLYKHCNFKTLLLTPQNGGENRNTVSYVCCLFMPLKFLDWKLRIFSRLFRLFLFGYRENFTDVFCTIFSIFKQEHQTASFRW